MRRLTLILIALALAAGLGATRPADAFAGGDNSAVAINTKDGSSLFRFAFKISRVAGDVVDNENVAIAWSKCESCKTTAIAIQIVLVTGSPSTVTPQNVAVALNEECTLCETFASAYQFVIGTDGPVKFTKEGRKELKEIKRAIRALEDEDLSPFELQARLDPLIERLRTVLRTQLVPAGRGDDDGDDDDGDGDGDGDGDDDEDVEESRDLGEDERPTTSTTEEGGGSETTTTPTTTTDEGTTETVPTESTPTETNPTESTPTETSGTTTNE